MPILDIPIDPKYDLNMNMNQDKKLLSYLHSFFFFFFGMGWSLQNLSRGKPVRGRQAPYDFAHTRSLLNKINEKQNRSRLTDTGTD